MSNNMWKNYFYRYLEKIYYLLGAVLIIFLSTKCIADTVDDFPDDNSKQVFLNFLADFEEYDSTYRINFYDYETHQNTKKLPCSFDKMPSYQNAEKCATDLLKDGGWLIVGDSHGRDLYNALKMAYPGQNIAMFQQSSCAPARTLKDSRKNKDLWCFKDMPEIINFINTSDAVKKVIFASRFVKETGTDQFIKDVRAGLYKKDILIFGAGAAIFPGPMSYIKTYGIKDSYLIPEAATNKVRQANAKLATTLSANVKIYDVYSVFCDINGSCKVLTNLSSIFRDEDSHLLREGLKIYGEHIKQSKLLD